MPAGRLRQCLAFLAVILLAPASAAAQTVEACSLLSNAEFEKVTGRKSYAPPEPMTLAGGTLCGYDSGQLIILTGPKAVENWNGMLTSYGQDKLPRHPVPGVGDGAYSLFTRPRSEYEDANAFVVFRKGAHLVAASVAAEEGKPPESALPLATSLATAVAGKLK